jgi:hypothetical protein
MGAVVVLVVLVILGACAYVIWGKTRATVSVTTNQNKDQLRDALTNFLTHRKYIVASQSENLMTFVFDKSASCLIGFLLLCLGLIPGILYLALGGSTKTLTVQFSPLQSGWNVRVQGQRSIVMKVKKTVGLGAAPMMTTTATPSLTAPSQLPPAAQPQMTGSTPMAAPISQATPALGVNASRGAEPVASGRKTCPSCGANVNAGLKFCTDCGGQMA